VAVHAYNPSTWEVKAGGSQIQGQPGLHTKPISKTIPDTELEHIDDIKLNKSPKSQTAITF
jgi:hypothetical protein